MIECPHCKGSIGITTIVGKGCKETQSYTLTVAVDDEDGIATVAAQDIIEGWDAPDGVEFISSEVIRELGVYTVWVRDEDGEIVKAKLWVVEA